MTRSRALGLLLALTALPALLTTCTRRPAPVAPGEAPPEATSPTGAARRFEWAVDRSQPHLLAGLLSADFRLHSAEVDSAGSPSRSSLPRDSVLLGFQAMLEGVPGRYPPAVVRLGLDRNLVGFPDTRPDADPRRERIVHTSFQMTIEDAALGGQLELTGALLLHATRGDAAAIPPGWEAAGDSLHWWLEGIEDQSGPPGSTNGSLRGLLDFYRRRAGP